MGANVTKVNGSYDHGNVRITLLFESGAQHTLQTCSSINYSNNHKRGMIKGTQAGPVTLTDGSGEPGWDAEISEDEHDTIVALMGEGYTTQNVTVTVLRELRGRPSRTDTIEGAACAKDDKKSTTGDPRLVTIGGEATMCIMNGIKPWRTTE